MRIPLRGAAPPVAITYPEELPISSRRAEIGAAIRDHPVVIVCGETGSGKTTQLPKICLELGRGAIAHTQPRRLAARATAARVAAELKVELGTLVGYKIRFNEKAGRDTRIKLMTDGILLAESLGDPHLSAYDTLIIDEAHERSLNIDFLLGYLKQLLPRRPDLKVVVTSATIDAERFAQHFASTRGPAPVVEVSGRLYPVEVRYRPVRHPDAAEDDERDLEDAIVDAVDECATIGRGDILIFLPGEREIRDTAELIAGHFKGARAAPEILPLYARLSTTDQERIFKPSGALRRVVLATNVAETSLTVPGIRFVIDPGLARVKRYSYRNKVELLQVEKVSQASASQRAGRCGRVASGVCIRLYDEADFAARPRFTDPEVLRSSLAAVILRMKSLRLPDIEAFPFLEAPPAKAIADGVALLKELGALDDAEGLTGMGRELASLPLDPRVARMILGAREQKCVAEVLIIAAALSVQDPRDRPVERAQAADQAHVRFRDDRSEFLGILKLWHFFDEAKDELSNRKLAEACRTAFLSVRRMREWRDVHTQLAQLAAEQGWPSNARPATPEAVHRALLTGLLGNIGLKSEGESHYLGARGIRFHIHPGSALVRKAGRWVVAAELVETTRLYARTLASIDPQWIEAAGAHLLKRSWHDPRWEKNAGRAVALERATLHGLPVYTQRRIDYAGIDARHARELFIRGALVAGEFDTRAAFFAHNRRLRHEIEELEHKSRRPDVLVDDELIFAFYDQVIPAEVVDARSFDAWREAAEKRQPRLLHLKRDDLMRHEAAGITTDLFPKATRLSAGAAEFALAYHFEPGSPRDGVTATVPLASLNQIDADRADWLVPGMRKEKSLALLKSLPQRLRRGCVPLPEFAAGFADAHRSEAVPAGTMAQALARMIRERTGSAVPQDAFRADSVPAHLVMNFKLVDEHGRQIDLGRNLAALRAQHARSASASFAGAARERMATAVAGPGDQAGALPRNAGNASAPVVSGRTLHAARTQWDFGDLEELVEVGALIGYPAVVDRGQAVDVELFDEPRAAEVAHAQGLSRLLRIALAERIRFLEKNLDVRRVGLLYAPFGGERELASQLIDAGLARACLAVPLPRSEAEFISRLKEGRERLTLITQEIATLVARILEAHHATLKKLAGAKAFVQAHQDMQAQLERLLPKNFIIALHWERLAQLPRYLQAVALRIDRLRTDPARDTRLMAEMAPLLQNHLRRSIEIARAGATDARLDEFRWLLEELRVSLFAQELRTPMPVSVKRLQKAWDAYRAL